MPFVEPVTIKDAVENIYRRNYLLPAIQREFVWSTGQIEKLFDSIMRDYPISSFLFWDVEKENVEKYQFYEFLQNYHERDSRHNPKAILNGQSGITSILDGQQRLTSLYIGLKGTYASRLPRKHKDNDSAFPKKTLHVNLLEGPSNEDGLEYDFRFLTKEQSEKKDASHFWFAVGDILNLKEPYEINAYLIANDFSVYEKKQQLFANRTLFKLHQVIYTNKSVSFFLEREDDLEKVLNIFVRVNSGGTTLSYSDLLLSIATATFKDRDAREEITSFVDEINAVGDGFAVDKDFVLKSCLVLGDFSQIAFKVENFTKENMLNIETQWEEITKAIKLSFILLSSRGYHRDSLTSNNAIIPIAYYLRKLNSPSGFPDSSKYEEDRKLIFKWLVVVLLKKTFSGQPDSVLIPIRNVLSRCSKGFPFNEIVDALTKVRPLSFGDNEIENLLLYQYAEPYTYSVLSFIYPSLDFRNRFHQDHIFPRSWFSPGKLKKRGFDTDKTEFYLKNFNCLANIQLLEGIPNQQKSGKDFNIWLNDRYPDVNDKREYMKKNYIPDVDLSFDNFPEFIEKRKSLIVAVFKKLLS